MTATLDAPTDSFVLSKTPIRQGVDTLSNMPRTGAARMVIDEDAVTLLMDRLINLYSDPYLAVVREYSTNAADSHAEAGVTEPIEVSLPSALNPNFVVKDHGVGMSPEDIDRIFRRWGASTKRNDMNQVGAFGFGGKAALTLSTGQQFTLSAVKDGIKSVTIVSYDSEGVPEVNVVSVTETTDSNGVTVTIPIPDSRRLNEAAEQFFATWRPGTILVDGAAPKNNLWDSEDRVEIDTSSFLIPFSNTWVDNTYSVILGGARYNIPANELRTFKMADGTSLHNLHREKFARFSFYTEVPIGAVDLTPSREALLFSSRTRAYLERMLSEKAVKIKDVVHNLVNNAASKEDALRLVDKWFPFYFGSYNNEVVKYRGEEIPRDGQAVSVARFKDSGGVITRQPISKHGSSMTLTLGKEKGEHFAFVSPDFDGTQIPRALLGVLSGYIGLNDFDINTKFFFFKEQPSEWEVARLNITVLNSDDVIAQVKEWRRKKNAEKRAKARAEREAGLESSSPAAAQPRTKVTYAVYKMTDGEKSVEHLTLAELRDFSGTKYLVHAKDFYVSDPEGSLQILADTGEKDFILIHLEATRSQETLMNRVKDVQILRNEFVMEKATEKLLTQYSQWELYLMTQARHYKYSNWTQIPELGKLKNAAAREFFKSFTEYNKMVSQSWFVRALSAVTLDYQFQVESNAKFVKHVNSIPMLKNLNSGDCINLGEHLRDYIDAFFV